MEKQEIVWNVCMIKGVSRQTWIKLVVWFLCGINYGGAYVQADVPPNELKMAANPTPLYRMVAVLQEPWVMESDDGGYTGFVVDVLDEIAKTSEFEYTIQTPTDHSSYSNTYQLMAGMADIGAVDLQTAKDRVLSTSEPFLRTGAQILLEKPVANHSSLTLLLSPLSASVWISLLVTIVVVGGAFYLIDRVSPYGWRKVPLEKDKRNGKQSFNFGNTIVFVLSTISWQGYREVPRCISGRILAYVWWAFTVLLLFAYSSNLTALLLASGSAKPVLPFKTFTEMASQSDVVYGGWLGMVLNPNDQLQRSMDRFMASKYSHYSSLKDAVSTIRKSNYAAIVNGADGEYLVREQCDLLLLREELFPIEYGIACRPGPEGERLCANITRSITKLLEDGTLYQLRTQWWGSGAVCPKVREEDYVSGARVPQIPFRTLSLGDLSLCFLVLLLGIVLSSVVLVAEVVYHRGRPDAKKVRKSSDQEVSNSWKDIAPDETTEPRSAVGYTAADDDCKPIDEE